MRLISILLSVAIIIGCKTKNHRPNTSTNDTIDYQIVDTNNYSHLPKWSDTLGRFSDAYVDIFSVDSNYFRFVNPVESHQSDGNPITLQKLINGNWTKTNLILEQNFHMRHFYRDQDVNGDGYIDIVQNIRFSNIIFFYNPKTKTFIDSPSSPLNPDWILLDKQRNIYCDFQPLKEMCDDIHSKLYTYNGFTRIDLYDLTLYNCTETNNETDIITKLILSKCLNGDCNNSKVVEEIKLDKPIDISNVDENGQYSNGKLEYFDYKKYWTKNYKKLLGSS